MSEGDLLVAEIKGISYSEKLISLHIRNDRFGKLGKGVLVEVNNCLIGKMKQHFVEHKNVQFIFGINGFIWMSPASGVFTAEFHESVAKFRNLIGILNDAFVSITADFLFEINALLGAYKAKDLIVPENRVKITDQIKSGVLGRKRV